MAVSGSVPGQPLCCDGAPAVSRVLLVSLSAPELDHLAGELAARHALLRVVRRYVNQGRRWERALEWLPSIGSALGRRLPPNELRAEHVPQAQLPEVYRAADVFVFPTLLEGLGLVVLEA